MRKRTLARVQRRRPVAGYVQFRYDVPRAEYDRYAEAAAARGYDSPERWAKEVLSIEAWEVLSKKPDGGQ